MFDTFRMKVSVERVLTVSGGRAFQSLVYSPRERGNLSLVCAACVLSGLAVSSSRSCGLMMELGLLSK